LAAILSKFEGGRKLGRSLPDEHIPEVQRNPASTKAWLIRPRRPRELIFGKRYAVLLLLLETRDHFIPIFKSV
jgi:hypothetical protein